MTAPESLADVDARVDENKIVKAPAKDTVETANEKTDADMPPIESLDENSDYSQFLSPKVSQTLRSVALRKLFHMAGFNVRDGLDDYDEDFTHFEPLGNTITADMRYRMEREKEKERQRLAREAEAEAAEEKELIEPAEDALEPTKSASVEDEVGEHESGVETGFDEQKRSEPSHTSKDKA